MGFLTFDSISPQVQGLVNSEGFSAKNMILISMKVFTTRNDENRLIPTQSNCCQAACDKYQCILSLCSDLDNEMHMV
jgi:hypothetical protein